MSHVNTAIAELDIQAHLGQAMEGPVRVGSTKMIVSIALYIPQMKSTVAEPFEGVDYFSVSGRGKSRGANP